MGGGLTYFVSDVHLGLNVKSPKDREARFVSFLESLPPETSALYLLGDIWDFWYEYRDVVPKGYVDVLAAITRLVRRGTDVYFFRGNHDIWTYGYFEDLGMKILEQPFVTEIGGKVFCLGHGDGLGPVPFGYRCLRSAFHSKCLQAMFSMLHPWIAFRIGNKWSEHSRLNRSTDYVFDRENDPLYRFASEFSAGRKIDYFIFGHLHVSVDMTLASGSRFFILKDWMDESPYLYFDGIDVFSGNFQNREK